MALPPHSPSPDGAPENEESPGMEELESAAEPQETYETEEEIDADAEDSLQPEAELTMLRLERDHLRAEVDRLNALRLRNGENRRGLADRDVRIPQKEHQRQVGELQRRIQALENSQRERTQEFTKEREGRIKAERQLASAERALEENAKQLESVRNDAKRALGLDPDGAASGVAETPAVAQLRQELQNAVEERDDALRRAGDHPASEGTAPLGQTPWENRIIAQLEADIESYRHRIKTLLQERDELIKSVNAPAASSTGDDPGEDALRRQVQALQARLDVLQNENQELAAARNELQVQVSELLDAATAPAPEPANHAEYGRVVKDLEEATGEVEQLRAEIETVRLQKRHEAEKFERELEAAVEAAERGTETLRKTIDTQQRAIAALTKGREGLEAAKTSLGAELQQARNEQRRLASEMENLKARIQEERAQLTREVEKIRTEQHSVNAGLAAERDDLHRKLTILQQSFAALEQEKNRIARELADSQGYSQLEKEEWEAENAKLEELVTQLRARIRQLEEGFATERTEREKELNTLRGQLSAAQQSTSTLQTDSREWAAMQQALETQITIAEEKARDADALLKLQEDEMALREKEHRAELARAKENEQAWAQELATLKSVTKSELETAIAKADARHQRELEELRAEHQKAIEALRQELTNQVPATNVPRESNNAMLAVWLNGVEGTAPVAPAEELNEAIRERDEALVSLEQQEQLARKRLRELEEERTARAQAEAEMQEEFELQFEELKRSRDSLTTQCEQLRQQLEQAGTARADNNDSGPPVSHVFATSIDVSLDDPAELGRRSAKRRSRKADLIEITESDATGESPEPAPSAVTLPPIRPLSLAPPKLSSPE